MNHQINISLLNEKVNNDPLESSKIMNDILDKGKSWKIRKDKLLSLRKNSVTLTDHDLLLAKYHFFRQVDDNDNIRFQIAKLLLRHKKINDEDLRRDPLVSIQKLARLKKNIGPIYPPRDLGNHYCGATGGGMPSEIFQVVRELRNIKVDNKK